MHLFSLLVLLCCNKSVMSTLYQLLGVHQVNHWTWAWAGGPVTQTLSSTPEGLNLVNKGCCGSGCSSCKLAVTRAAPRVLGGARGAMFVKALWKHQITIQINAQWYYIYFFFHNPFWSLLWVRHFYVHIEQSVIYPSGNVRSLSPNWTRQIPTFPAGQVHKSDSPWRGK